MTKTYNARPGTRITASAGARRRQPAPDQRRRLSHVPAGVPGAAQPAGNLTAQSSRLAGAGGDARHGRR